MRKGEQTKREILQIAEKLFCSRGFRNTGVQDILDSLHISKGSFYHHFESKDSVLEALCVQRADKQAEAATEALRQPQDPLLRVNAVLACMSPLQESEADFLAMLLPQMFTREGRSVMIAYFEAVKRAFLPVMTRELKSAAEADAICTPTTDAIPDLVMTVAERCTYRMLTLLLRAALQHRHLEPAVMLDGLRTYRAVMERLLDAPLGSIELVPVDGWYHASEKILQRIILPDAGTLDLPVFDEHELQSSR